MSWPDSPGRNQALLARSTYKLPTRTEVYT